MFPAEVNENPYWHARQLHEHRTIKGKSNSSKSYSFLMNEDGSLWVIPENPARLWLIGWEQRTYWSLVMWTCVVALRDNEGKKSQRDECPLRAIIETEADSHHTVFYGFCHWINPQDNWAYIIFKPPRARHVMGLFFSTYFIHNSLMHLNGITCFIHLESHKCM